MSDPRDEIARIIADAEQAAYQRGWHEALLSVAIAAKQMCNPNIATAPAKASPPEPPVARPGRPSSNTVKIVGDIIIENPGMSGVDVVKAAQAIDSMIKERTVRTALRRMRLAKVIWKRSGLWYPKAKEKSAAENGNGEAVGSPPH
ncbi:MAG TPA: hypothetical protein VK749_12495 [Xanthobacteraceae bacterium]|jgi:hypothetical protein|nr:hypothetical protein [Xanthobacteraceae bacterium]